MHATVGASASRWTRSVQAVDKDAVYALFSHASQYERVILDQHVGVDPDHPIALFKPAILKAFYESEDGAFVLA